MFEHLKINNIRALNECALDKLGKINVICGKNNSGKSTLLEGIHEKEKRLVGKEFGRDVIEIIYAKTVVNTGWQGKDSYGYDYNGKYRNLLERVSGTRQIWFADDAELFQSMVLDECNKQRLNWSFDALIVGRTYASLFVDFNTVLIPPKRQMQISQRIEMSEPITPNGGGILNYLFYAKNQYESSDARATYKAVDAAFTKISSGYRFDVFPDNSNLLSLNFAYNERPWIDAKNSGMGLQDLIVILFFAIYPHYQIVLIEEPENHLHPDMQRKLIYFLREGTDKQFFLTTHSNIFLNNALIDRVFFTSIKESVVVDDATSRAFILDDLGYEVTDNLVSDLIILVEGPSDVPVIEEFLLKLGLPGSYNIKMWPLGGDIMDQLDLSVFAEKYSIIALTDRDPKSRSVRDNFEGKCKELGIEVCRLERYAIENYFSLRVLKEVFKSQIDESIAIIEPDVRLSDQIGIDVKKNNRRLAKQMTIEEIMNTDLYDFLMRVEQKCKERKDNN